MYEKITTNIMVENVEETIKFYEEKLGFKTIISVPSENNKLQFAILNRDNIEIMFQEKKNLIEEYPSLKTDKIKPTFTLFINVKDINLVYEELKGQVEIIKEIHKTFYGKDEFAILDNSGNILTISN